jgi:uncharacterized protein (TIGR02246 family)
MNEREFRRLLQTVSDGWNAGDARSAAECFAEDAVYVEPPDRQRYVGRKALFDFFGGGQAEPRSMSMAWHHIAYDSDEQLGFGEYTFTVPDRFTAHGVAVVAVRHGLIASWREYQYRSEQTFKRFAGDSLRR